MKIPVEKIALTMAVPYLIVYVALSTRRSRQCLLIKLVLGADSRGYTVKILKCSLTEADT